MSEPNLLSTIRLLRSKHGMSFETAKSVAFRFWLYQGWSIPAPYAGMVRKEVAKDA